MGTITEHAEPIGIPRLHVPFRSERPVGDSRFVHFSAAGVRRLMASASDLGRSIQWVMDGHLYLTVIGSEVRAYATGCDPRLDYEAQERAFVMVGAGTRFAVPIPFCDLSRLFALSAEIRSVVIRVANGEYTLAAITDSGAVLSLPDSPIERLRRADELLMEMFTTRRVGHELFDQIEDYLRERHLIG